MKYLYLTLLALLIGCGTGTKNNPIAKIEVIASSPPLELNTFRCNVIESEDISESMIHVAWLPYQEKTDNFISPREGTVLTAELKESGLYYELIDVVNK